MSGIDTAIAAALRELKRAKPTLLTLRDGSTVTGVVNYDEDNRNKKSGIDYVEVYYSRIQILKTDLDAKPATFEIFTAPNGDKHHVQNVKVLQDHWVCTCLVS